MNKRIKQIVPDTQQEITTTVEIEDGQFTVEVRACSPLDKELRSEFHELVQVLGTKTVSVKSRTDRSNQGNETGQDVTIEFESEHTMDAVDVIDEVVQLGKDFYDRQLERELGREESGDSRWRSANQLKYFDSQDVKEFCLLFNGRVNI